MDQPTPQAFTLSCNGLANVLIAPCEVFIPYNLTGTPGEPPKMVKFNALWDTGATNTTITENVVNALGLVPTGMVHVHHANGSSTVPTFIVNMKLLNNVIIESLTVSQGVLNGFDILIGMDIISRGDFCITNKDGKTIFTFQYPSTHSTDYVKEINKATVKNIGRNDPCLCGSGKKFKQCCVDKYKS